LEIEIKLNIKEFFSMLYFIGPGQEDPDFDEYYDDNDGFGS
jgi:hypothetical protein